MAEPPQGDFQGKLDRELFELIQVGGRSSPRAAGAFTELYNRYERGVAAHGKKTYPFELRCDDDINEYRQQVFIEFWKRGVMTFDRSRAGTPEEMKKLIRFWLAKSGGFVIRRWQRDAAPDRRPTSLTNLGLTGRDFEGPRLSEVASNARPEHESVDKALNGLTPRERDVVLTCVAARQGRQCRVPEEVKLRLMRDHGFKNWDAVRQCLKRTLSKLKDSLVDVAVAA